MKIIEAPVIRTHEKTQQLVNTHVQLVVNTVEVEETKLIKETVQRKKPIDQEKINQVTSTSTFHKWSSLTMLMTCSMLFNDKCT